MTETLDGEVQLCRCDHYATEHHRSPDGGVQPCTVLIVGSLWRAVPAWCGCLDFTTAAPPCHRCGHKANRHDKFGCCADDLCPCNDYAPALA
jgi:hypothetical protein